MATQPNSMSTTNSIGAYDGLFDDDTGTLEGGSCFDLDMLEEEVLPTKHKILCSGSSLCNASSSSCSLCCPPLVSEASEDNSNNIHEGLNTLDGSVQVQVKTLSKGIFDKNKPPSPSNSLCACTQAISSSRTGGISQVPIKSILIPSSCFDLSAGEVGSKPLSTDAGGCGYLSSSFLPDDSLGLIANFLDVPSLIRLYQCNKKINIAISGNRAGWKDRCITLWSNKAHVCSEAREMLAIANKAGSEVTSYEHKFSAMEAYKISVTDAAERNEVSFEEICFDSSQGKAGTIFNFCFKNSAGIDWTSWDPWWNGRDARKLVFLRDGTIKQVYPESIGGNNDNDTTVIHGTRLYRPFSDRTVHREDGTLIPAPQIHMKWRFVTRPLDLPARPRGAYVRISVGGRDVPTYTVSRSPTGNWGFVLQSCWGVYASFKMAPRVQITPVQSRRPLRWITNGNRWVEESDSEDENGAEVERERVRNVRRRVDPSMDISAMTNNDDASSQWREALLYNIGAVTLPEGNGDMMEEFDSTWREAMRVR